MDDDDAAPDGPQVRFNQGPAWLWEALGSTWTFLESYGWFVLAACVVLRLLLPTIFEQMETFRRHPKLGGVPEVPWTVTHLRRGEKRAVSFASRYPIFGLVPVDRLASCA